MNSKCNQLEINKGRFLSFKFKIESVLSINYKYI